MISDIRIRLILCFVWLGCMCSLCVRAQVSGVVRDDETGEPLPMVHVYYEADKRLGTTTDLKGNYQITSNMAPGKLIFSYMGYITWETNIKYGEKRTINVRLQPADRVLSEVLVKPKRQKYRRKDNPAVELMRKVIAAKEDNSLEQNDYYKCTKYQKITFAFNNISPESLANSGIFRKMPLLAKQVEYCPQTGKNILPLTYNETVSELLYRKLPREQREYVRGKNSQGLNDLFSTGEMAITVLQSVFTDVNIYDNSIYMLERPFTSPISSTNAISFYQYFIMDTLDVAGDRCYELSFIPQNPQDFGFSGRLFVLADGSYQVKRCVINLPVRTSVNFVNNLVIEQEFGLLPNGRRGLVRDDMFAELGIVRKHRSLMVKRATRYSNFSFDSIPDMAFREKEQLREGTRRTEDEVFWAQHRPDTLTRAEAGMKDMLANARNTRGFGWIMFVARAFIENYVETAPKGKPNYVDIGPVNTIVSTNFIEKFRVRASAQTTANLNPHLFLRGYVAYGVRDRKWKYEGHVEYSFLRKQYSPEEFPKNSISFTARHDVMSPTDQLLTRDKDNVFVSFKTQMVDHMMYFRNYTLKYEYEFGNSFGIRAHLRHARQTPTGALFYRTLAGRHVDQLKTSEATLQFRFSPGEQIINTKQRRRRVNNNAPIFTLKHTTGFKGILSGDYTYNYTELTAYKRVWFHSFGRMDINLHAGGQWNKVPFPLLIMPAANNSYIISDDMFSMINNMEFMNDRFASLDVEWDMNGKIFNRIPLLKRLKWREVIGFRTLYGTLTDKNNPMLHAGDDRLYEFPSRGGQTVSRAMGDAPYMEVSAGIHNILKILRIDYVRRLNYLYGPNVKKNGVRLALQFDF
ncbi:MAG: DUF5686 and carboxypeptidase regulatory-like domain-containing protein [Clostridium sp.]|nr:DUF5686 and carboxypeptidase regulatory-like domain-containing protein [Clostridium sp.]